MKAIMYHYVRPDDPALPYFRHLHVDDFERQLDHFSRHSSFVTREGFEAACRTGRSPGGVLLTFDDGFADHYRHVLPLLRDRGLWGIFYVPIGPYLDGDLLDVHWVHLLIGTAGGVTVAEHLEELLEVGMLSHDHVDEFRHATYARQDNDDATRWVKRTLNYYIDYGYRSDVIRRLVARLLPDPGSMAESFYMTPDQMREMQAAGMVLGSHAVTHRVMSRLTEVEQRGEIERSFATLDELAGPPTFRTFCYPYGGFHTFTDGTERLLERAGCLASFNVEPRDIADHDLARRPQALPRFDCNAFPYGTCRR